MSSTRARSPSRLDPQKAWTFVTDAPLQGFALAREATQVFAWDQADNLYVLDPLGHRLWASRAPGKIVHGSVSDDGRLLALLGESRRLWLFGADLELQEDRETLAEPLALAVDPHARFVVVASRLAQNQIYTAYGRNACRFDTLQPLANIAFVPQLPVVIGSAGHGSMFGIDLFASGGGLVEAEVAWRQSMLSNVGRLTVTGDGGMILASCFSHGIQRFDSQGQGEGAYHLGGTVTQAVPDFLGRLIAAATQEGDLALLNRAGNIRWKATLERPAVALEMDALGRFLVHGDVTGGITRWEIEPAASRPLAPSRGEDRVNKVGAGSQRSSSASTQGAIREPAWKIPVAKNDDQAQTAVVAVAERPDRIALITSTNRLQIFDGSGVRRHEAAPLGGVGRFLRLAPGWVAAATDRQLLLHDLRSDRSERLDLSLVEVTHLQLRPENFGLLIVQERDRIGRATIAGRWVWLEELNSPIEDVALGPRGHAACTTEDGMLRVFDPAGKALPSRFHPAPEPLALVGNPSSDVEAVSWITLSRHKQILRGHEPDGTPVWELPIPWLPWQLLEVAGQFVVTAPDGRAIVCDELGRVLSQRAEECPPCVFGAGPDGRPVLLTQQGHHLICSTISGQIYWRAIADPGRRPWAIGPGGAALFLGRDLAWFPWPNRGDTSVQSDAIPLVP